MVKDNYLRPMKGICESYQRKENGYSVVDENGKLVQCSNEGERRIDNTSDSGIHCDECWRRLIDEARSRSW